MTKKSKLPMKKDIIHSDFTISFDSDFITKHYNVTPIQAKLIKECTIQVHGEIDQVFLRKLEKLSKENPSLPQLKNYLTVAYHKLGNYQKAMEVNHQLVQEFPDYLHGRLNLANHYMEVGEHDKALQVLGKNLDLKELFPTRKIFHFSEVQAYYYVTIIYATEIGDLPLAENRLAFYKAIDQNNPRIEELEERLNYLKRYLEFKNEEQEYNSLFEFEQNYAPITDKISPPVFQHPEIHQLYQLGFKNAIAVFDVILRLPRESVVADLELVLKDGIERYCYFLHQEWSVRTHAFVAHAIFLLMELKATESLPSILDLLQYDDEFLELYLGADLTEDIWQCMYLLGKEKVTLLKEFLLKSGVSAFAKETVSVAIMQVSIREPHRRKEIEQVYKEVLTFFINAEEEDNVIDPMFLGFLIDHIGTINLTGLFPLIEELYELGYIDESLEGDFIDFVEIHSDDSLEDMDCEILSLQDIYSSLEGYEIAAAGTDFYQTSENEPKVIHMTPSAVKVNRNDPCPCGSGKKYKKCCGQV